MKHPDWHIRLDTFIRENMLTPFEWGKFDCCLFVADAVEAMTGTDFAAPFRGRYTTATGSARALKKYGSGDVKSTLTSLFGEPLPRLLAGRGDIVLVNSDYGHALGICWGGQIWVTGPAGLHALAPAEALCTWRVN